MRKLPEAANRTWVGCGKLRHGKMPQGKMRFLLHIVKLRTPHA